MTKDEILRLIEYHGKGKTKIIAIEEFAEIQKEITKDLRGELNKENLTKELADVCICLEMIQTIYEIEDIEVVKAIKEKMEKNLERIEVEKNGSYPPC